MNETNSAPTTLAQHYFAHDRNARDRAHHTQRELEDLETHKCPVVVDGVLGDGGSWKLVH